MCEICTLLQSQRMAAIEQGSVEKLTKANQLIARHAEEHKQRDMELAFRQLQAARVEGDTLATPQQRRR